MDLRELAPPSPGFALGDMEVEGNTGVVTSRGHRPDQSMMIFVAASDLLDGLRDLVERERRYFRFVGCDSSFRLDFARSGDGLITTADGGGRPVDASPAAHVLGAAFTAADCLLWWHREKLPGEDAALRDLEGSVRALGDFLRRKDTPLTSGHPATEFVMRLDDGMLEFFREIVDVVVDGFGVPRGKAVAWVNQRYGHQVISPYPDIMCHEMPEYWVPDDAFPSSGP
ncbi:hypothetical protein AB0Q95_33385 [Streptomyces sp. NPDC059900]|uniref:hypothetical protein n=1 Tax=Streptomyces sp. NPDC059900 TaxID=3155816 RepID=UPI003447D84B